MTANLRKGFSACHPAARLRAAAASEGAPCRVDPGLARATKCQLGPVGAEERNPCLRIGFSPHCANTTNRANSSRTLRTAPVWPRLPCMGSKIQQQILTYCAFQPPCHWRAGAERPNGPRVVTGGRNATIRHPNYGPVVEYFEPPERMKRCKPKVSE
jgi:hypothetical protein